MYAVEHHKYVSDPKGGVDPTTDGSEENKKDRQNGTNTHHQLQRPQMGQHVVYC